MDIKRILLMIATFALGAVLLVFIFLDAAKDKASEKARREAEIEARQYEIKIQDLEVEITEHQKANEAKQDQGMTVIGFHLSGVEDVATAISLGETYGFRPTVVLDCTKSSEELLSIVEALQAAGYPADIMLTGTPFDENVLAAARMMLSEIPARDFTGGISFLLRYADDSEKNRSIILDEAFSGYSYYSDKGESGTHPSGTPFVAYSFMRSPDINAANLLKTISSDKTSMILVMDLASVAQGTLEQQQIIDWIEMAVNERENGNISINSIDEVFGELRTLRAENDAEAEAYEKFKAEKESEIAELREKIAEIKK